MLAEEPLRCSGWQCVPLPPHQWETGLPALHPRAVLVVGVKPLGVKSLGVKSLGVKPLGVKSISLNFGF